MKYSEFENVDKYCKRIADKYLSSLGGSDFNQTDIRDAFDFMRKFEKSSRFDKAAMEVAKKEAEKVLTDFEKFNEAKKDEALREKKEKVRLREELKENAPTIWKNDLLPKFKDLFDELETFTKRPGFEPYILSDQIKKELVKIEDVTGVVRQKEKVYIKQL